MPPDPPTFCVCANVHTRVEVSLSRTNAILLPLGLRYPQSRMLQVTRFPGAFDTRIAPKFICGSPVSRISIALLCLKPHTTELLFVCLDPRTWDPRSQSLEGCVAELAIAYIQLDSQSLPML